MSKFLKLLEQAEPVDVGSKQEMMHKLAELFNLIDSVEVSSNGENIMVDVGGKTLKLSVVNGDEEEDSEDPASIINRNVKDLAAEPPVNGKFAPINRDAQRVVKQKDAVDRQAVNEFTAVTNRLKNAITAFKSKQTRY
jgi:hypothetical protein